MQVVPRIMVRDGMTHLGTMKLIALEHHPVGTRYELWLNPATGTVTLATDGIRRPRGLTWSMPHEKQQMDWIKGGYVVGGGYLE